MDKKIYLKDLSEEELEKIILNNQDFLNAWGNALQQVNYDCELEDSYNILGDDWYHYIETWGQNLDTWLTLVDTQDALKDFLDNLDTDYLSESKVDGHFIKWYYDHACYQYDKMQACEYSNNEYWEHYKKARKYASVVLRDIANLLRGYEAYPSDEEIFEYVYDNNVYEDYYTDSKKKNIYQDVVKTYN